MTIQANAPNGADLLLHAEANIQAAEGEQTTPTVEILAYNGGLMSVGGYGPVAIDLAGLELGESVPLLADHKASLSGIVGQGKPRLDGNRLIVAGGIIEHTEAARTVRALARDGFTFQASVGVRPQSLRFVRGGEVVNVNGQRITAPPVGMRVVEKGKLREVSILALGADDQTQVNIQGSEGEGMPLERTEEEIRAEERGRLQKIHEACGHLTPTLRASDEVQRLEAKAISGEISMEDFHAGLLKAMRDSRPAGLGVGSASAGITREAIEAKILLRAGLSSVAEADYDERTLSAADAIRADSLVDIAAACLRLEGRDVPRDRNDMIRAAFSTLSLPTALGNSAHKALMQAYNESGGT